MKPFEELCTELIVLSEALYKEKFRYCFFQHFIAKIKEINETCLGEVSVSILQRLQLKLSEPVMLHLRTTEKCDDKCLILECLIELMRLTCIEDVNFFFHLYALVFFQIYQSDTVKHKSSEELKMIVLNCGSLLIKSCSARVLNDIYKVDSGAKFSMGISISVQIAREERSINLRVAALDFLLVASQFNRKCMYNRGLHRRVGDLFMLYLPGTLGPLQDIISRDETQHHKITLKALQCWGHILCVVMCDPTAKESLSENDILRNWMNSYKTPMGECLDPRKALKETQRTKDWTTAAAETLKPLIWKMLDVRKHSNSKCRLELTKVMINLVEFCASNLKTSLTPAVEILVSAEVDENEEVREEARRCLGRFEKDCSGKNANMFGTIIEENLYSLMTKLPGVVHQGNDGLILSSVKALAGYMRMLSRMNRLRSLTRLSSTLRRILIVLQMTLEMETHPEISSQELSIWDINSKLWSKPWKRFRHFCDESTLCHVEEACRTLGEGGDLETIIEFLVDAYDKDHRLRKEALLLLSGVVLGGRTMDDHVVDRILDFYLEPEKLYLPLQVNEIDCPNLKEAQFNIIKVALIMEGIGNVATTIGKRFQDHLFRTLYYVVEKMGSSYLVVRQAATKSANKISEACCYGGDIGLLIQSNIDYLTFHLTTKLKRINNAGVFDVLTVLIKNSPFGTMPSLEEVINNVLSSISDNFDSPHVTSYLRLFQTFVFCVNKWIGTRHANSTTLRKAAEDEELEEFIKYLGQRQVEEEDEETVEGGNEDEETVEGGNEGEELEKAKSLPRHISMTLSIAKRSLHYLSSKDRDRRLLVLEILNESVWILSDWENELLPLVHKIWSPLVTKYDRTNDPLIINRSFTLLITLAHTSKQFIRSRTLKEVLPSLRAFLIKTAMESRLKDSSSGYYFTQNYKLQKNLLENLGKIALDLELHERQTDLIVESAFPYLSSFQPKELQEKCRLLFEYLTTYDPFLVWFKLHSFLSNSEYAKNVQIILTSLQSIHDQK